jgi:hypothetical protein
LGFVVRTLPSSNHIVGYSGPTNTLIAFSADERVLGIDIHTFYGRIEKPRELSPWSPDAD